MRNEHADGMAEDLVRSIIQMGCAEVHAKTLYEKKVSELEEGFGIDLDDKEQVEKRLDEINEITEEINSYAEIRRKSMLKLYQEFEGDKTLWCQIKHLGIASYTLFEAYQGSDDDRDLLDLAYEANKAFIRALSKFLGVELVECAACISDMLKAKGESK